MNLLATGIAPITAAPSDLGAGPDRHLACPNCDLRSMQGGSAAVIRFNRAEPPVVVVTAEPPRILVINSTLVLNESHLVLLRAIPAKVTILSACEDMYAHKEHDYRVVILVLSPVSRETPEAAHFIRHRWSAARILLVEGESTMIDDWLYDDRIDPGSQPWFVRQAAVRLIPRSGSLAP